MRMEFNMKPTDVLSLSYKTDTWKRSRFSNERQRFRRDEIHDEHGVESDRDFCFWKDE